MPKQMAVHKRADQKAAMYRLMLSLIVVLLANDDAVGAGVRYQDYLQYRARTTYASRWGTRCYSHRARRCAAGSPAL
jgi:hypothetical protein